jgi:5-methylcytosine-specific restriction protein A
MWPQCVRHGVAAIEYDPVIGVDFSKFPRGEAEDRLRLLHHSQRASILRFAYELAPGDAIYVKDSTTIVGRGTVIGAYQFDALNRIMEPSGKPWQHLVPVKWEADFAPIPILVGRQQHSTLLPLDQEDVARLTQGAKEKKAEAARVEEVEGEERRAEVVFRSRSRFLIDAKKAEATGHCEACGFHFAEAYGPIGRGYIVAHHLSPIAMGQRETTLADIALVCANCHAMLHRRRPPFAIEELQEELAAAAKRKRRKLVTG